MKYIYKISVNFESTKIADFHDFVKNENFYFVKIDVVNYFKMKENFHPVNVKDRTKLW